MSRIGQQGIWSPSSSRRSGWFADGVGPDLTDLLPVLPLFALRYTEERQQWRCSRIGMTGGRNDGAIFVSPILLILLANGRRHKIKRPACLNR